MGYDLAISSEGSHKFYQENKSPFRWPLGISVDKSRPSLFWGLGAKPQDVDHIGFLPLQRGERSTDMMKPAFVLTN